MRAGLDMYPQPRLPTPPRQWAGEGSVSAFPGHFSGESAKHIVGLCVLPLAAAAAPIALSPVSSSTGSFAGCAQDLDRLRKLPWGRYALARHGAPQASPGAGRRTRPRHTRARTPRLGGSLMRRLIIIALFATALPARAEIAVAAR